MAGPGVSAGAGPLKYPVKYVPVKYRGKCTGRQGAAPAERQPAKL